jgi:hypothetical protein
LLLFSLPYCVTCCFAAVAGIHGRIRVFKTEPVNLGETDQPGNR